MFFRLAILCLLNCITETIQVTERRRYLRWGPHVGHHWPICCCGDLRV